LYKHVCIYTCVYMYVCSPKAHVCSFKAPWVKCLSKVSVLVLHIYIYITHIHLYYTYTSIWIHIYEYSRSHVHVYVFVYTYIHIYMCVLTDTNFWGLIIEFGACTRACVCTYIHIHIHIHIHIRMYSLIPKILLTSEKLFSEPGARTRASWQHCSCSW